MYIRNEQTEGTLTRNSILHALVPDDYRGDCFGFLRQRTTPILFYFSMDHNFKMIRQTISFAFAFVVFSSLVYYFPAFLHIGTSIPPITNSQIKNFNAPAKKRNCSQGLVMVYDTRDNR